MFKETLIAQPPKATPVILSLTKIAIITAINLARKEEGLNPIPNWAEVSVGVPGGGDYSNCELSLSDITLDIRWNV